MIQKQDWKFFRGALGYSEFLIVRMDNHGDIMMDFGATYERRPLTEEESKSLSFSITPRCMRLMVFQFRSSSGDSSSGDQFRPVPGTTAVPGTAVPGSSGDAVPRTVYIISPTANCIDFSIMFLLCSNFRRARRRENASGARHRLQATTAGAGAPGKVGSR